MKIALILILAVVLDTCDKTEVLSGESCPSCFKAMIKGSNAPLEIWQYNYNNQTVYLVKPACCDQYEQVYTTHCTAICAPSGGITGKGDGKCPDFYDVAAKGQLIWKAE